MSRNVVTKEDVRLFNERARQLELQAELGSAASATAPPQAALQPDKYKDRLLQYIPADIIAVYLALRGFVAMLRDPAPIQSTYWVMFVVVLTLTIPWQRGIVKIDRWSQVMIGTGAFIVWAVSVGRPFTTEDLGPWYQPAYGAMLLVLYTFLIPLFEPTSTREPFPSSTKKG